MGFFWNYTRLKLQNEIVFFVPSHSNAQFLNASFENKRSFLVENEVENTAVSHIPPQIKYNIAAVWLTGKF